MSDILIRIKRAVLAGHYTFAVKAQFEMECDGLTGLDVAESILNAPVKASHMNLKITTCPTCGKRRMKKVCRDWSSEVKGKAYTVPSLEFYECPDCGERMFDPEAMRKIESYSPVFAKRRRLKRTA